MPEYATTRKSNVTKGQLAYDVIRNAIISGDLKPGQTVSIRELSGRFDLGLTPVNDAMKRLIYERWLVSGPNVKTIVAEIDFVDCYYYMQVRGSLEILACRLCAQSITEEKALEFDHCMNKAALAIRNRNFQNAVEADIEFHLLCARMSDNPILSQQYEQLLLQDQRIFYQYMEEHMRVQSHEEHCEIVGAIKNGDADQAEDKTRSHLKRLLATLMNSGKAGNSGARI